VADADTLNRVSPYPYSLGQLTLAVGGSCASSLVTSTVRRTWFLSRRRLVRSKLEAAGDLAFWTLLANRRPRNKWFPYNLYVVLGVDAPRTRRTAPCRRQYLRT
jgi:hypothetical protein